METHVLEREILLPGSPGDIFPFFSRAENLDELTPSWLHFRILTELPLEMKTGTLIDYKLRVRLLPIRWRSKITTWEPPHRFVDEQVRGPYRSWIHEHTFLEQDEGTLVRDRVEYAVWGGSLINRLLVRPDLERIFSYRFEKLEELFPPAPGK
ncbi:MAG: SRPBCC family protein [Planctomycetota bacterium]|nr:SRPBCC family protein [Planctomycetota bacterium]MEE3180767.1 SRPBCC family protein [Planctomycetota bacterium]